MKHSSLALLILLFLFGLVFWVKPSNILESSFQIGVLIPGSVEFFAVQKKGLDQAAQKYGLNLIYADAEWDTAKQLAQVENFISRRVDLILLCSVDNQALQGVVPRIQKANIPLITFSNTIGNHPQGIYPGVLTHVGRDEIKSGTMLGRMVENLFKNHPVKILLIQGAPGTSAQRMREKGFLQITKQHKNWKIVSSRHIPGWTKEGALNAVEDFLQTEKAVDVVVAQWWAGAIASAMALDEKGISNVKVVGLEFSRELVPYLQSGKVDISTYFSIIEEGFKTAETASLYLKKMEIPNFVEIIPIWVTKKNLHQFEPEL